jgi:hypothetical protein
MLLLRGGGEGGEYWLRLGINIPRIESVVWGPPLGATKYSAGHHLKSPTRDAPKISLADPATRTAYTFIDRYADSMLFWDGPDTACAVWPAYNLKGTAFNPHRPPCIAVGAVDAGPNPTLRRFPFPSAAPPTLILTPTTE